MTQTDQILGEYLRLRADGLDTKTVLGRLRADIEKLDESAKQSLARQLRALEARQNKITTTISALETSEIELIWINCPHCGKSNQKHELLCYACGRLLERANSQNETHALAETNDLTLSEDFFGQDSVLLLRVRDSDVTFEVRPQIVEQHEVIIGRGSAGSALIPDIDLASIDGEQYGVSRLHLSVRYQPKYHTLSIFDLGSANGSYINGQRLHPHEVRVLRHGDELRLGRLMLTVAYRHT